MFCVFFSGSSGSHPVATDDGGPAEYGQLQYNDKNNSDDYSLYCRMIAVVLSISSQYITHDKH